MKIFVFILFVLCFSVFAQNALVLQTDFGTQDGAVAAMKGVAFSVDRSLPVFDLTHNITAFEIWEAAYRLWQTVPYWPSGTVFVSVIDPGVGTERKSIVLQTLSGHYLVTPDNGTATLLAETMGIKEVREIDEKGNRLPGSQSSYTFHGRDIYAYTGARLASGKITWEQVGPSLGQTLYKIPYVRAEYRQEKVYGTIPVLDPAYGNIWTNIPEEIFQKLSVKHGDTLDVTLWHKDKLMYHGQIPYARSFGDVAQGEPLLYLNSLLQVAIALNMDNFSQRYEIRSGSQWHVQIYKKKK
mgnify:CR=1 FL=1